MKVRYSTAPLLLIAALALTSGAAADDNKPPEMSPEVKLLPGTPGPESFGAQPEYTAPYDAGAELAVYNKKYMNKTAFPPVDLGQQLYERGYYEPRRTYLGRLNPVYS